LTPRARRNRQRAEFRADLASALREWLAGKLARLLEEARQAGDPIPAGLPPDTPVFKVPSRLVKILDRDLRLAGIPKRDDRGRTLDVHALRHTFGTLLSKGGVAPRTAQAAMRHSDIKLTMNVYTDPRLLDVGGALDALPEMPLQRSRPEGEASRATGTDDEAARKFAPGFAPTRYKPGQTGSSADKNEGDGGQTAQPPPLDATSCEDKRKGRLSSADNRPSMSGRLDSNQRPPEPHLGWRHAKGPVFPRKIADRQVHAFHILQLFPPGARILLPLLPAVLRGRGEPTRATSFLRRSMCPPRRTL
jgi:hypothetical protein